MAMALIIKKCVPAGIRKSAGAENTFLNDLTTLGAMLEELPPLIDKVGDIARRMRADVLLHSKLNLLTSS